jgi:hypothetical protein
MQWIVADVLFVFGMVDTKSFQFLFMMKRNVKKVTNAAL